MNCGSEFDRLLTLFVGLFCYCRWITCFTTMGFIGAFGVFVDLFSRSQAASPSAISWIGSTQNFLLTAVAAVAGRLLDAGHFKITMLSGSALFVLGSALYNVRAKVVMLI